MTAPRSIRNRLREAGLANGRCGGIKILGDGDLTRKLTVSAHAFSASAKAKIEAKGGDCEVIAPAVAADREAGQACSGESQPGQVLAGTV